VHFAVNVYGHSFDVPVNDGKADIPDVLLQTDGNLNVWGFVGTAGDGYTRISKVFRVNRRNKPSGYTYTPTAQISLETIRKEIEETKMDTKALYSLSYGLFVLTARENDRDNGCIINTAMQVTSQPNRISITVNKANHTHDMIHRTGVFNLSVLGERTPFSVFERFGFSSGRDVDKFAGDDVSPRAENGVRYLGEYANALLSGRVFAEVDCGTHTLFLADLTDAAVLSDAPSMTYAYYFANVKPKPQTDGKKGYVCKICGYVYEGEPLPEDFICPLCKHGAADFEPIK
jgi:flavin reductase (DIM6/NTAB) family NADH-FMN oxidoreductase RutF